MKGSTQKRCTCPVERDARGRRKACAKRHGSWSYVIDVGKDPETGRRKQYRGSGFATQAEAAAAMAEMIGEVDQGRYRHDRRLTVKEYLEAWMEEKAPEFRPTTRANARAWLKKVYPHIGHLRLRDLQASHISKMNRDIVKEYAARGLSSTTAKRIHQTLSSALTDARRDGLIRHNPAFDAWRPAENSTKVNPWGGDELGQFLDHAASHRFGTIYELMAMGGLRRGEALGLRWADVNLEAGFLVVRQQLVAVQLDELEDEVPCATCAEVHRGLAFGPPKTSNGEARRVDLGQTATGALLEHRLRQDADRAELDELYVDHDLVFADVDGNPLRPDHVTKSFTKLAKSAGVRRLRLHDLRHGRASLLLASGADMAKVSKMLGHGSIRITADTYSHLLAGVGNQAADAADSLIVRQPRALSAPGAEATQMAYAQIRDQSVTNVADPASGPLPSQDERGR